MTSWFKWNRYQTTAEGRRDFDLLLKVTSVENIPDNDRDVLIRLVDSNQNQYHIQFENRSFTAGEVLKIRSVRFIEDNGTIQKSDYSNILKLPQSSWDAKHFSQLSEEPTQSDDKTFNTNEFSKISSDPSEAASQYSLIKQIHLFQNEIVPLQTLLELQQNPNCFADFRSRKFRVSGYVIDVFPRDLATAVKKISYQTQSQCVPLSEGIHFDSAADLSTILEVQIVLKDESIDASQQTANLVLIQEESQAHHDFFDGVHLRQINSSTLHKYQKQFDKVVNKLIDSTSIISQVEIIVQPIIFNDKLLFRIQDTQFIA